MTKYNTNELDYLAELKRAEERLPAPGVPDVRSAVWSRIESGKVGGAVPPGADGVRVDAGYPRGFCRSLTIWEVAAALAVAVGAGILYESVGSAMSEMYWSGSLHLLSYLY